MSRALGERFDLGGWRFAVPVNAHQPSSYLRKEVAARAVAALEDKGGAPFRRSRHATTWKVQITDSTGAPANIFVKQLDLAQGLVARAKAMLRIKRSEQVLRISEALRRDNFGVPDVLLIGENLGTGSEVIVMAEAPGLMLTRWMNPSHRTDALMRRAIFQQLGAEVGRLHLSGYIHGDLTPYNIFATGSHPIAITFIDHEGTGKTSALSINLARNRLRNLVQLGHFDIPGVSRTDRLRVFTHYAAARGLAKSASRQSLVRLIKMIERRRRRDRSLKRAATQPAIIVEEGALRG